MYKHDIGMKAGEIWNLLLKKGALNIREIGELTSYKESFIHFALGWLSRENKIRFYEKGGLIYVELDHVHPEFYI